MLKGFISKTVVATCTDCGTTYNYDINVGQKCPNCGSNRRNYEQ